jgi:chorismate synthase
VNTFGKRFRLTTYGESHGLAVGGVIDGCPSGLAVDFDVIERDLARRRVAAPRKEEDHVEWLSGLKDGVTLGSPIAFSIRNKDARPADYAPLGDACRPGHADYTYLARYGLRDANGSGRASARETVARVVAGALDNQVIYQIQVENQIVEMGPDAEDDTRGGIVECRIDGLPAGVGDPIFGKLNATLAAAMMSIPSAIGFEIGAGFAAARMKGSEYIDRWSDIHHSSLTQTNHCGGVQGGISNGMPVVIRVAFHPVCTLPQPVECREADGTLRTVDMGGRHDRCQVLRTPVIVEAMAALVVADFLVNN